MSRVFNLFVSVNACSVSDITEQQKNRDDSLLGGKQSVTFRSLPNKSLGFGLKNILCKKVLKLYACWLKTSHNISSVSHTLLTKEGTRNYLIKEFAGKKRERRLPGCHLRLGKNWWRGDTLFWTGPLPWLAGKKQTGVIYICLPHFQGTFFFYNGDSILFLPENVIKSNR